MGLLLHLLEGESEPPQEELLRLFNYSLVSGRLWRRVSVSPNTVEGQLVTRSHNAGYLAVGIQGKAYLAHRVIWCMVTGQWPTACIDHSDGRRDNNCWLNLREASRTENNRNTSGWEHSKSGVKGVYPARASGRWEARITVDSKALYLGTYDTVPEAKAVYDHHAKLHFGEFHKQ